MGTNTEAFDWALSKGVPGVLSLAILALVYVVKLLWNKNNDLQLEKDKIRDERLSDAKKNTEVLLEVTAKTNEAIDSLEKASDNYDNLFKDISSNRRIKP